MNKNININISQIQQHGEYKEDPYDLYIETNNALQMEIIKYFDRSFSLFDLLMLSKKVRKR